MRHGLRTLVARWAIYRLAKSKPDARSWRPNLLVLSGAPTSRWYLIEMANALVHHTGFLTVACVVPDRSAPRRTSTRPRRRSATWRSVVVRESGRPDRPERPKRPVPRIDIWWGRERHNAGLMLAVAYLLQTSTEWFGAELRIFALAPREADADHLREWLDGLVTGGRVRARTEVVVDPEEDWLAAVRARAAETDLILLPLRSPREDETDEDYGAWYTELIADTDDLPALALVMANEKIRFDRIFA